LEKLNKKNISVSGCRNSQDNGMFEIVVDKINEIVEFINNNNGMFEIVVDKINEIVEFINFEPNEDSDGEGLMCNMCTIDDYNCENCNSVGEISFCNSDKICPSKQPAKIF
jgi:hypothetical protein